MFLEVLKPKMSKISPEICVPQNIRQNKYIKQEFKQEYIDEPTEDNVIRQNIRQNKYIKQEFKQEYIDEPTEDNVNYDPNDCQTTW